MFSELQHAYRDGRFEEVVLRHFGNEDGKTVIAKHIRFYPLPLLFVLCYLFSFRWSHFILFSSPFSKFWLVMLSDFLDDLHIM